MIAIKLFIDLIPNPTMGINLRNAMKKSSWSSLSKRIIESAHECEICGKEKDTNFHCHEVWDYDHEAKVQNLVSLKAVCFKCHMVTHWGYANLNKSIDKDALIVHFCTVNDMTKEQFEVHKAEAVEIWRKRNLVDWVVVFGDYEAKVDKDIGRQGTKEPATIMMDSIVLYIEGMEKEFDSYYKTHSEKALGKGKSFNDIYDYVLQEILDNFSEEVIAKMKHKSFTRISKKGHSCMSIMDLVDVYNKVNEGTSSMIKRND